VGNQPGGIMARWENVQVGKRQSGIMGGGKMAWWENDIWKMGRIPINRFIYLLMDAHK
jgi:hypothetical protein